ncbi:MAG TPA: alpha/beta fold hydrolase [Anaeromyxobacteraceae bacterium]|nr:alpha/beta fold hydrolase [Anaeromyxobacteraceae bacterium]
MHNLALGLALVAAQAAPAGGQPTTPRPAVAPVQAAAATAAAPLVRPATSVAGAVPVAGRPNLLAYAVPEVPGELAQRAAPLLEARAARLLDVSANGEAILIATRFGQSAQLHVVEQPLGVRTQITFGREPVLQAAFLPGDPAVVFFLQDAGGAENYQLYRLDRRGGRPELVTDGKSRHENFVLSPDGRRIAWSGTGRNGRDTDVYVAETRSPGEARRLVEGEGTFGPLDFSTDGERLLVRRFRSAKDGDLLLVDVATGERHPLTPAKGKGSVVDARFTADGKGVYLVTDRYGDFNELYRLDPSDPSAPPRPLSRTIRWDVEHLAVARDGSRVAVVANADGVSRLYFLEPRSGKLEPGNLPSGVVQAIRFPAKGGSSVFAGLASPRIPGDVWQLDLRGRKLVRWTRSEIGGLDPSSLAEPALVRYPAKDGLQIPALLYRPKAPGRRPVVVVWHGGPEAQERPVFQPLAQILVEGGIAVLLPNVRGSSGYGKAYEAADDGARREDALQDIGATLDFIASQPDLDASRVAAYGGSYGGFMSLATVAFYPDRVRSAVDVVGISSIPTFLESTASYRRDLRRAEYGDERDPAVRAVQERISPLYRAEGIRASLYVIQGHNDPRVPQSEAEQIVAALRRRGGEVWYLLALDEGHGFQKRDNRDVAFVTAVLFLERTLSAGGAAGPASP